MALSLGLVAGEASGDLLGGLLLAGLREHWPELKARGIGGPKMAAQGFESWWPHERLAVFGYADALKRLPELLWIRRSLGSRLLRERPSCFVGIDAPDFNFGLERRLKQAGVPAVHFVCPSIWAWRGERVHKLAAACDHVLCLFPFEPALLAKAGVAATYVGHPVASIVPPEPPRAAARAALGLAPQDEVAALLPGSRGSEIALIGPAVLAAAQRMAAARPGLRLLLPCVPSQRARLDALVAATPVPGLSVLEGRSHEALAAADTAIVASGTATLEAALLKCPMVITYRLGDADWRRMERMRYQPWVGLPNILAGRFVVPELIQQAATPDALAAAALHWLDAPADAATVRSAFAQLHDVLRQPTGQLAAGAIAGLLR